MTIRKLLIASCGMIALTACNTGATSNRSVNTIKAPTIASTQYVHDVAFSGMDSLSQGEARSLDEYLSALGVSYGDRISIDDPQPQGVQARRAAIAAIVARHGLLLEEAAPVTQGAMAGGSVRVVIVRATANVAGCPDWSRASSPDFDQNSFSNSGCANVSNLAAMVADPNDLVHGRDYAGADATSTVKAIKTYREKKPTGLKDIGAVARSIGSGATSK